MTTKPKKLQSYEILKFSSTFLKRNEWVVNISLNSGRLNRQVVSLAENEFFYQLSRLKESVVNWDIVDALILEKRELTKKKNSNVNRNRIRKLDCELDSIIFIPEIVSIEFDSKSHYKTLQNRKLVVNDKEFVRFLAGAGNIRSSTVFFIEKSYFTPLTDVLDNGRDKNTKLNPAKLNAYFGLYASSGFRVAYPRFAVIPDYEFEKIATVDFIDDDNDIKEIERTLTLNAFDGQGLISPKFAKIWADGLGLEYTPSNFIIRSSFIKGLVVVFDYKKFAKSIGVEVGVDLWGNRFPIDDTDIVLSESQFKLWDSYLSLDDYIYNSEKNDIPFRVTRYSPKQLNRSSSTNYMFLQVLDLAEKDIKSLSEPTLDFFRDVRNLDERKTSLFLSGSSFFDDDFGAEKFCDLGIVSKSILVYPKLLGERYISSRISNVIKKKEQMAKLGKLIVEGQYQIMVSDPYGQAQWLCGMSPRGLLKEGEHYSKWWYDKGERVLAAARSPLTHNSEMVKSKITETRQMVEWYKYLGNVYIMPINSLDTLYMADSD